MTVNQLCSPDTLKYLLNKYGFRFSKSMGQNFLIDSSVPVRIADAADLDENTGVLEVGAGFGCLTAATAMYSRRLVKDQKDGKDLQPTIDKMNEMIQDYDTKSKPLFCAQAGLVDEIVDMPMMRNYIVAFADSCYQNPDSICPFHQMLLPRTIKDYNNLKK